MSKTRALGISRSQNDCDVADGNDENVNEENAGLVQVKISRSFPALSFPPGQNTRGLDNKNSNNNIRGLYNKNSNNNTREPA